MILNITTVRGRVKDDRGWDDWCISVTQWHGFDSSWWWTGSKSYWVTELNWTHRNFLKEWNTQFHERVSRDARYKVSYMTFEISRISKLLV